MSVTPLALAGVTAAGALSGFLGGLTGSAGTYLALSLLTLLLADAHLAVGTTLVYALALCVWGAVVHHGAGRALPGVALAVGLPAAGTAVAGAWLAEGLPDRALAAGVVALTVTVIAATVLGRGRVRDDGPRPDLHGRAGVVAVLGGLALGLLQGLLGVGGGFLLLPLLVVVLRVPTRLAVACTLLAGIPGLLAGAISHLVLGNVDAIALGALLLGALPLAWVGARATGRVAPATVRRVVLGLLTVSSAGLVASAGLS